MIMNLLPVLKETVNALQQLLQNGESHVIYTNKMPFSKMDIEILTTIFQRGEIEIVDNTTNNKAVIFSTVFPGIWITTLWGRALEFTPILEILEINWNPSAVTFPLEDCIDGFQQLLEAVKHTPQIDVTVYQELKAVRSEIEIGKEMQWELNDQRADLLHYILVPGSITLQSPAVTFQSTQFWGVWLGQWRDGRKELVVSGFPEVMRATPPTVQQGCMRLQMKFTEISSVYRW